MIVWVYAFIFGFPTPINKIVRYELNNMSKVKVLIVQQVLPSYSVDFFNELARYNPNVELHIAANVRADSELNQYSGGSNFKVHNYNIKNIMGFSYEKNLFHIVKMQKPSIVILSGNVRSLISIPLLAYLKVKNVPTASWGMFHRIGKKRFISQFYYWMYASLSCYIFVYGNKGLASLSHINIPRSKIHVIGTAIDETRVFHSKEKVSNFDILKIKEDFNVGRSKVVLQVVRLSEIKKPQLIIEVAKTLVSHDIKFFLIGDGKMREEIETKIRENNLSENVIMLGSIYDEDELAKWYSLADIFVIPTCIGLSAHHAMAYGLPIITDDSYIYQATESELLINGLNGLTYNEGDVCDFKEKILYLINNDELRAELSNVATKTVKYAYPMSSKVCNFSKGLQLLINKLS